MIIIIKLYNKKTISDVFPFQIQNGEEEFEVDKIIETIKEKTFEQNLNKNERIKGVCTIDKIKNILRKNKIEKNIIDKIDGNFITNKDKESVSLFEIKVKQERNKNSNKEIKLRKKMGRKNKNDTSRGKHDKNAPDNIIKKCKRIFFENAIIYINFIIKIFGLNQQKDFEFKKLDYKKMLIL